MTDDPDLVALVTQRRKFRRGCLYRIPAWRPSKWKWAVGTGDGREWRGMTPEEAWENWRGNDARIPRYRGPREERSTP